jgi:FtsP/CotA-like multicopper oxidase with cupredoxin domain
VNTKCNWELMMALNRRDFLKLTATGLCVVPLGIQARISYAGQRIELILQAEQRTWLGETNQPTALWGMGQEVLRLKQNQPVEIVVKNQLPEATSLHWHGLRIPNAMDGVSGLTQQPINPGEEFVYRFTPKDAGTYWAHAHHNTYQQLARGLYLPMIVEESTPYSVDQDHLLVLDDWLLNNEGQLDLESLGNMHEWAHGGRMGNVLTVNRQVKPRISVTAGSRVRLRILNAANARIMVIALPDVSAWICAKDGQPLEEPSILQGSLTLSPAERYDLIVDIPADWQGEKPIFEVGTEKGFAGAYWDVSSKTDAIQRDAPARFPENPLASLPDVKSTHSVQLLMEGGAMGGLRKAIYQNKSLMINELVQHKQVWALNGIANLAEKPLLSVKQGDLVEIEMVNNTRWAHGMHLHGHHFQADSSRYQKGLWHDTLLMERGEKTVIRFVAEEPGKWLLHCHMIEHQAAGMVTWLEVTA